jgi:hypothetical protein
VNVSQIQIYSKNVWTLDILEIVDANQIQNIDILSPKQNYIRIFELFFPLFPLNVKIAVFKVMKVMIKYYWNTHLKCFSLTLMIMTDLTEWIVMKVTSRRCHQFKCIKTLYKDYLDSIFTSGNFHFYSDLIHRLR